jgi:hypothetical protein
MDIKQKLSLVTASALPVLAISAYLMFAPARASATSCPSGELSVPVCGDGYGCAGTSCTTKGAEGEFPQCGQPPVAQCVTPGCIKCE